MKAPANLPTDEWVTLDFQGIDILVYREAFRRRPEDIDDLLEQAEDRLGIYGVEGDGDLEDVMSKVRAARALIAPDVEPDPDVPSWYEGLAQRISALEERLGWIADHERVHDGQRFDARLKRLEKLVTDLSMEYEGRLVSLEEHVHDVASGSWNTSTPRERKPADPRSS